MKKKADFGDNDEIKAAQVAAIDYLTRQNCDKSDSELAKTTCYVKFGLINKTSEAQMNWGIYNYFYKDGKCDYETFQSLDEGQE